MRDVISVSMEELSLQEGCNFRVRLTDTSSKQYDHSSQKSQVPTI